MKESDAKEKDILLDHNIAKLKKTMILLEATLITQVSEILSSVSTESDTKLSLTSASGALIYCLEKGFVTS